MTTRSLDPRAGDPVGAGKSPPRECCARLPSPNCEAEPHTFPESDSLAFPKGRGPQETRRSGVETAAGGGGGGHDEMNKVYRIRGTAGGDRINYDGPTKANTTALFVHSQNPAPVSRV